MTIFCLCAFFITLPGVSARSSFVDVFSRYYSFTYLWVDFRYSVFRILNWLILRLAAYKCLINIADITILVRDDSEQKKNTDIQTEFSKGKRMWSSQSYHYATRYFGCYNLKNLEHDFRYSILSILYLYTWSVLTKFLHSSIKKVVELLLRAEQILTTPSEPTYIYFCVTKDARAFDDKRRC